MTHKEIGEDIANWVANKPDGKHVARRVELELNVVKAEEAEACAKMLEDRAVTWENLGTECPKLPEKIRDAAPYVATTLRDMADTLRMRKGGLI